MSQNKNQDIGGDGSIDTQKELMNQFFRFYKNNELNLDAIYDYKKEAIVIDTEYNGNTTRVREFAEENNLEVETICYFHRGDILAIKIEDREDRDLQDMFKSE